jgi:hypothetical protein
MLATLQYSNIQQAAEQHAVCCHRAEGKDQAALKRQDMLCTYLDHEALIALLSLQG